MRLDEIHQKDNPELFTDAFILEAWDQGRGELLGYAKHLERSNASSGTSRWCSLTRSTRRWAAPKCRSI